jgi:hypothetical protein
MKYKPTEREETKTKKNRPTERNLEFFYSCRFDEKQK